MSRAVVETNVLVSALLSPLGNEAMVVSAIVIEYGEIPARPKFARVLEKVPSLPNLLDLAPCGFTSSDQRDQALLDCAVAGDVDFIVTGNRRHFPDPCYGRTEVVSARQFLNRQSPAS